jgi:uncharacterized protein YjbJ (UPF0337 family)
LVAPRYVRCWWEAGASVSRSSVRFKTAGRERQLDYGRPGSISTFGKAMSALSPTNPKEGPAVATTDKAKNSSQEAKGKLKEAVGKASGNKDLRAKGKADQTKANLKQAGEKVKDAL